MPMLFALGQHRALQAAARRLGEGEHVFAFLDDIYIRTCRERAREEFDVVTLSVAGLAQTRPNLGKCRVYAATLPAYRGPVSP